MNRFAVVMAGGAGTRFWPKSSARHPKQFLTLVGRKSMLQMTMDRLDQVVDKKCRFVVGTSALRSNIKRQLGKVPALLEPEGRNTMAAVCWSAWEISRKNPNASIAVLPADAFVGDEKAYKKSLREAFLIAEKQDRIVCLGIKPTFPATGYGYIEVGAALGEGHQISRFVEKPNSDQAQIFVSSGRFVWNAGIFVFKASVFIDEVRIHAPIYAAAFDKIMGKPGLLSRIYKRLPKDPVDVALMEKTTKGALVSGDFGWNDVGSWLALEEVLKPNSEVGLIRAPAGHASLDSHNMIIDVTPGKFVGLVGVKDLIVIETPNALLICSKSRAQDIKALVGLIEKNKKLKSKFL